MLLDNFSPMTGVASPNRFGVVDGVKDQYGRAARGGVGGDIQFRLLAGGHLQRHVRRHQRRQKDGRKKHAIFACLMLVFPCLIRENSHDSRVG